MEGTSRDTHMHTHILTHKKKWWRGLRLFFFFSMSLIYKQPSRIARAGSETAAIGVLTTKRTTHYHSPGYRIWTWWWNHRERNKMEQKRCPCRIPGIATDTKRSTPQLFDKSKRQGWQAQRNLTIKSRLQNLKGLSEKKKKKIWKKNPDENMLAP